jgi:hypothetical protein
MESFQILALPVAVAEHVRRSRSDPWGNRDIGATPVVEAHSAPCRVCLRDAAVGDEVLLFGYSPFVTPGPYRTVGPIFVHAAPCPPFAGATVPDALRRRLLSVRAHGRDGRMLDAEVTPGDGLAALAGRLLAGPDVLELHVHHARPGCFACRIVRP